MSLETSGGLHPALRLGAALPSVECSTEHSYLYVSMSDLIMEHIFYHPGFESVSQNLKDVELESIHAILGEVSTDDHFVSTLTQTILQAVKPEHEVVRLSLSNADSYAFSSLLGGSVETSEVNPALGLRGVSRYASESFGSAFALECKVVKALQGQGVDVQVVVPFVRTLSDVTLAPWFSPMATTTTSVSLRGRLDTAADSVASRLMACVILSFMASIRSIRISTPITSLLSAVSFWANEEPKFPNPIMIYFIMLLVN